MSPPNLNTMPYPPVVKGFGIKRNGGVEIIELPFPELQPGNMLVKVADHFYL